MLISGVTLDKLHNLFVRGVSFLENEEDNASLAIYLVGILAEQMSSCSVYEAPKGKMLAECEVCFHHINVVTLSFCSPSQPMEGPLLFLTGPSHRILTFLSSPTGLFPVRTCWRICGAVWDI